MDNQLSRRAFIRGAAVLSFGIALTPGRLVRAAARGPFSPSALLRIDTDDHATIIMPHADLGGGIYTGLAQILAEELDADWTTIRTEHLESLDSAFNHQQWGVIATGASTSVTNQWQHFRTVGATARAMLVQAAAESWGVEASTLRTERSTVVDPASGRRLRYGELTAAAALLEPPATPPFKHERDFQLIGQSLPRLDAATKSDGSAVFGIDVQLPDMLHAAIAHPPVFGGRLERFDASRAEAMAGVRAVVAIPSGVVVVAESFWQAKRAKDALEIEWADGPFAKVSSDDLWPDYAALADQPGPRFESRGRVEFDAAARVVEGEMRFPFLAHAPMEPLNATARIDGDGCEIWAGTQFQGIDAANIAQATGIAAARLTIHTQWLGGSFGRRASPNGDFLVEAVQVAQACGLPNPIKLTWQREDDIRGGFYRPMVLHRYKLGLDDDGLLQHWQHRVVGASISKGTAFESAFYVDGFDRLSIEGLVENKYHVANVDYQLHTTEHPVSVCWLRGEADTHTGPAVEGIMNRVARLAEADPFEYRRRLLSGNPEAARILGVLDALESVSGWRQTSATDIHRGMAVHPSFGSVCGFVVELRKSGTQLDFHRVVAAFDCGRVINPDAVRAQVYSSVAFALSTLLGQKVEIENGRARQSNFHDYAVAALRHTPEVEVHFVDSGLDHPTGVGEVPVAPFIPAVTDAIYSATGEVVEVFPIELDGYRFIT